MLPAQLFMVPSAYAVPTMAVKPGKSFEKDCPNNIVLISFTVMRWPAPVIRWLLAALPETFSFLRTGVKAGR